MDLFVIHSKLKHCQIKIASKDLCSKIMAKSFPETFLVSGSLSSIIIVVTSKSKILDISEINLITGEVQCKSQIQQDIAVLLEFIDAKLINRFLGQLNDFFSGCNFFKNAILNIAERNCLNRNTNGEAMLYPKHSISEISTEFFTIKRISSWPLINREIIKTSEYINLILKKSLINGFLAYMTPLTWSTYVKELGTHNLVKEFMPTAQKMLLSLLYNSGIYKNFLITKLMKYLTMRCGAQFDTTTSARVIARFVKQYKINMEECAQTEFASFNEFFYRKLKPDARKIEIPGKMSSPADCRILGSTGSKLEIKGQFFSVPQLLNNDIDYKSVCISRLAPQDYHRFHAPLACEVVSIRNIQGLYHSVHPISRSKHSLDENMRTVIELKTDRGTIYYVAIGAMLVGSICLNVGVGSKVSQMDEIGYFKFGGSCIVMVTDFRWDLRNEIAGNTLSNIETIVKVGDCIEMVDG